MLGSQTVSDKCQEAKKAAEEAAASGEEQPKENKVTKIASSFLGVVVLIALRAMPTLAARWSAC